MSKDGLHRFKHAHRLYAIKVMHHEVGKTGDVIEVAMPNTLLGQHALGNLASIARSPKCIEQREYLGSIVGDDRSTIFALTSLIIGDDGRKTEHKALGKMALASKVGLKAGEVASFVLGERVEHDAGDLMVDEGVDEALQHIGSKRLQLLMREVVLGLDQLALLKN